MQIKTRQTQPDCENLSYSANNLKKKTSFEEEEEGQGKDGLWRICSTATISLKQMYCTLYNVHIEEKLEEM